MLSGESDIKYEGENLLKDLKEGMRVTVERALVDPDLSLPYLDAHIEVPHVLAAITDKEYAFCCDVALANLREQMRLPASAQWLLDQMAAATAQPSPGKKQGEATKTPRPTLSGRLDSTDLASMLPQQQSVPAQAAVSERLRASLHFGTVEMQLCSTHASGDAVIPLALLHCSHLSIQYLSEGPGHMDVQVNLPKLEAHDLRATRRASSSLILSSSEHAGGAAGQQQQQQRQSQDGAGEDSATADGAEAVNTVGPSMLTVHYVCHVDDSMDVAMRLQRPTVVAEVGFAVAMLKFVLPSMPLGADPTPFLSTDIQCASHAAVLLSNPGSNVCGMMATRIVSCQAISECTVRKNHV